MAQGQVWTRRGRQKESCLVEMIIYGRKSLSPWLAAPSPGGPAFQSPRPCVEGKEGLSWACGGAWRPGVEPLAREQVYPRWGDPEGERARDQGGFPSFWLEGWGYRGQKGRRPVCCPLSKHCPDDRRPIRLSSDSQHRRGLNAGSPGTGLAAQSKRLRGISVGEFLQQPRDKIQQAEAGLRSRDHPHGTRGWARPRGRPGPEHLQDFGAAGVSGPLCLKHTMVLAGAAHGQVRSTKTVPVTRTHFLLLVLTRPSFQALP